MHWSLGNGLGKVHRLSVSVLKNRSDIFKCKEIKKDAVYKNKAPTRNINNGVGFAMITPSRDPSTNWWERERERVIKEKEVIKWPWNREKKKRPSHEETAHAETETTKTISKLFLNFRQNREKKEVREPRKITLSKIVRRRGELT